MWTDLGALRYNIQYSEEQDDSSAVAWPVTGRFKNEQGLWNGIVTSSQQPGLLGQVLEFLSGLNRQLRG